MDRQDISGASAAAGAIPPCEIQVDEEGEWFHQGSRITRDDILQLFYENLSRTPQGEFLVEWQGSRCRLEVADTPFVVARVDRRRCQDGKEEILLSLRHLTDAEPLAPATLRIGAGNVLYCQVRGGRFPARFSRPAYYQLAEWIREDPDKGEFYLELNDGRHVIA